MRALQEQELGAFIASVSHFFKHATGDAAEIRSAFLADTDSYLDFFDFAGIVDVSGEWSGSLYFSAPRGMLSHILLSYGSETYTDEDHLDLIGEIANMFSGQARKALGEGLEISVPRRCTRIAIKPGCEPRPYVVPLAWRGFEAIVVVDLKTSRKSLN